MGAILGRIELNKTPVSASPFQQAFAQSGHYGPDKSQKIIRDCVALGAHTLSQTITLRSGGSLFEAANDTFVVADAILDNRDELISALKIVDANDTTSNAEIIFHAIRAWGKNCVHHLEGDYAFAFLDVRKPYVWLVKDHIGSRPLYWFKRGTSLLFGTSIESLVAFRDVNWKINEQAIAEYLAYPFMPVRSSFFSQVQPIPPGGYVEILPAKSLVQKWWKPKTTPRKDQPSHEDTVEECRNLLNSAVEKRVNSYKRIGSHFSGGLDSTGITLIAAQILRSKNRSLNRAFAWSPAESSEFPVTTSTDERNLIQSLAESNEIPVSFGEASARDLRALLQRQIEFEADADLADELPILRMAHSHKIGVLLSGWGGDEVFSSHGYGFLGYLLLRGRFRQARQFAHRQYPSLRSPKVLSSLLWRQVIHPLLPRYFYHRLHYNKLYRNRFSFLSNRLISAYPHQIKARKQMIKFGLAPNKNLFRHFTAGHVSMRMETWAAWAAPFGIQYRYPLTDRKLVEYLLTLPPSKLNFNNRMRGLARSVLSDQVPGMTSKYDEANEAFRVFARRRFWQELSVAVEKGEYDDDCPWIDGAQFRAAAKSPKDPKSGSNLLDFVELFTAARAWELYRRARTNGWIQ